MIHQILITNIIVFFAESLSPYTFYTNIYNIHHIVWINVDTSINLGT